MAFSVEGICMIRGIHINMYPTLMSSSIFSVEGHMDTKFKVHGPHIIILKVSNENETINLYWTNSSFIFTC
jgi:hypothetical protein